MKKKAKKKNGKIKRDVDFLFELGTFRHLDRAWKQFLSPDVANCSEHMFRVAWIALTIAKHEKSVDIEKLLKMALLHDLAESRCGDVHYLSRQYVEKKEKEAISDIFHGTAYGREMDDLVVEYEKKEGVEAKIVKDADNIDVELELAELKSKGYSLGSIWKKERQKMVYPKLYTETACNFWKEIQKTDPHNWHKFSKKNRFNGGDWKKTKKTVAKNKK